MSDMDDIAGVIKIANYEALDVTMSLLVVTRMKKD